MANVVPQNCSVWVQESIAEMQDMGSPVPGLLLSMLYRGIWDIAGRLAEPAQITASLVGCCIHIQMNLAGPVAHVYGSAACLRPFVLRRSVHQGMEWWATYELQVYN